MADQTGIEWCDSTFNPWIGCTKVSPACANCYAEVSTPVRTRGIEWGAGKERVVTVGSYWHQPVKWNARPFFQCVSCGWRGEDMMRHQKDCTAGAREMFATRRRVFCASLADWLDNEAPIEWLVDLLDTIRLTPNLDWLLLTKRIGNWRKRIEEACDLASDDPTGDELHNWIRDWLDDEAPANVWLGSTVIDQDEADRDVPKLLEVPARTRFLSIEPMLGAVDVSRWLDPTGVECMDVCPSDRYVNRNEYEIAGKDNDPICAHCGLIAGWTGFDPGIDWIICGGESGRNARPMHPDWVTSLRDQCVDACVPFLFKQWGEWVPRSACYHKFADGQSCGDIDPSCQRWPHVVRLTFSGGDGVRLEDVDGGSDAYMQRVGKKFAGRLLNGRTWDQYPEVSA